MNRQYARAIAQYILTKPEKLLDRLTETEEQRQMVIEEMFKLHHEEGEE